MEERQHNGDEAVPNPAWSTASIPVQPPFQAGPVYPPPPVVLGVIDRMPKTDQDRAMFAAMPAAARSAAYLNSIRKMMIFFVVLTITGIALSIILFILAIHAADQVNNTSNIFGQ